MATGRPNAACSIYQGVRRRRLRKSMRQLLASCWQSTAEVGQAGNVTAEAASTTECASFAKLLRLCILTTDMGYADGGSCATGASAFTMVVVGSGVSVLAFVCPTA
jgi:hypothetical protein